MLGQDGLGDHKALTPIVPRDNMASGVGQGVCEFPEMGAGVEDGPRRVIWHFGGTSLSYAQLGITQDEGQHREGDEPMDSSHGGGG